MQSWIHVIEWRANTRPELTALVDDRGAAYSYAQLKAATERRAGGWADLGIGPGDIVAVVAKNSADFLVHAFALMRAGATRPSSTGGCRGVSWPRCWPWSSRRRSPPTPSSPPW